MYSWKKLHSIICRLNLSTRRSYIESGFDVTVNQFIKSHFHELCEAFMSIGKEFYYMPMLTQSPSIKEKVLYYAPYLNEKILYSGTIIKSSALMRFTDNASDVAPSLLCNVQFHYADRTSTFCISPIDKENGLSVKAFISSIQRTDEKFYNELECKLSIARKQDQESRHDYTKCCCDISLEPDPVEHTQVGRQLEEEDVEYATAPVCYYKKISLLKPKKKRLLDRFLHFMSMFYEEDADDAESISLKDIEEEKLSLEETGRILAELRSNVQRLRLEGVSLMAIHEFIDKQEPLSPLVITEDYKMFLPDYNNMEIEMGALPKAIYFLFLRYPEGIVYKHMPDHYYELLNIYKQLRPNTDEARLNLTITKVINPLGNALNENIARIRKAFIEKFDEHLANKYIITGERGLEYTIPLNRNLVIWKE